MKGFIHGTGKQTGNIPYVRVKQILSYDVVGTMKLEFSEVKFKRL